MQRSMPPQVMDMRLRELVLLLPDLAQKLAVMQVKAVALMAADTQALATKLLGLRKIFPSASVSQVRFGTNIVFDLLNGSVQAHRHM